MDDNGLLPGSYSKLGKWERCPASVKYKYIAFLPEQKSAQMSRGSDIHQSAEDFLTRKKKTIRKELAPLAQKLLEVRNAQPVVEHKLAFSRWFKSTTEWKDKLAFFRLVLDSAYGTVDDVLHIQEWKSGKEYEDHLDQREIYGASSLVAWEDYEKAEVTTYYLDLGKHRVTHVDRHYAKLVLDKLNGRVERMASDRVFSARPGYYCNWCSFSRFRGGPCRVG